MIFNYANQTFFTKNSITSKVFDKKKIKARKIRIDIQKTLIKLARKLTIFPKTEFTVDFHRLWGHFYRQLPFFTATWPTQVWQLGNGQVVSTAQAGGPPSVKMGWATKSIIFEDIKRPDFSSTIFWGTL